MKTLVFLIICLVASAEPAALVKRRNIYLRELQKLESVHQQKVKTLTWRYAHELNKLKVAATKAGNLEDALAVKAEIDELQGALASDKKPEVAAAPVGRRISKIVIHQTTNGHFRNAGVKSGKILWYYGTRKTADRNFKKFKLDWVPGKDTHVEIRVSATQAITKLRLECDADKVLHAALAEIEVFDRFGRNISADAKIEVNSTHPLHRPGTLIDGATGANNERNWCANEKGAGGWIELTWK